jgi:DNA repair protein RadC
LKQFKTLQGVLEATPEDLGRVNGIGPKNLIGIKLIEAVTERYLSRKLERKNPLNNSRELFDYLYYSMRDKQRERFKVILLDAKNRVIVSKTLFKGTLTASSVYPREIVRTALNHQAAAVIFAHNHPSGDPKPSKEDFAITRQLIFACRVMGITVHEHIVIGNNQYFSFADQGHIARINREFDGLT